MMLWQPHCTKNKLKTQDRKELHQFKGMVGQFINYLNITNTCSKDKIYY